MLYSWTSMFTLTALLPHVAIDGDVAANYSSFFSISELYFQEYTSHRRPLIYNQ